MHGAPWRAQRLAGATRRTREVEECSSTAEGIGVRSVVPGLLCWALGSGMVCGDIGVWLMSNVQVPLPSCEVWVHLVPLGTQFICFSHPTPTHNPHNVPTAVTGLRSLSHHPPPFALSLSLSLSLSLTLSPSQSRTALHPATTWFSRSCDYLLFLIGKCGASVAPSALPGSRAQRRESSWHADDNYGSLHNYGRHGTTKYCHTGRMVSNGILSERDLSI